MMTRFGPARAAVNWRSLIVLFIAVVILVGGGLGVHRYRKEARLTQARAAGIAAMEAGDWRLAAENLRLYTQARPKDIEAQLLYAESVLNVRPFTGAQVIEATNVYRLVLLDDPTNSDVFRKLGALLDSAMTARDLRQIADRRLSVASGDPYARLLQGKAAAYRRDQEEAKKLLTSLTNDLKDVTPVPDELTEACVLLSLLSDGAEARRWAELAVEKAPQSPWARVCLTSVLRQESAEAAAKGDESRAAELADKAAEQLTAADLVSATDARALLKGANEYMLLGAWRRTREDVEGAEREMAAAGVVLDRARQLPEKVLTAYYPNPADWAGELFQLTAKLALLSGKSEDAVAATEEAIEALKDEPQYPRILPAAIQVFLRAGQIKRARECFAQFEEALKETQTTPLLDEQAAILKASIALAADSPFEAAATLEPVAGRSSRIVAKEMLADAYLRLGRPERAARVLEDFISAPTAEPEKAATAKIAASALLDMGRWAEASAVVQPFVRAGRADGETQLLWLSARASLATDDEALAAILEAIKELQAAMPERADVRVLRATLEQQLGDSGAARATLEQAAQECVDSTQPLLRLAQLTWGAGDAEGAMTLLEKARQQQPNNAAFWLAAADILLSQDRMDEARALLERGAAETSDDGVRRLLTRRQAQVEIVSGDAVASDAGVKRLLLLAEEDAGDVQTRAMLLETPQVMGDAALASKLIGGIKAAEGEIGVVWRVYEARRLLANGAWRENADAQSNIEALLTYCIDASPRWPAPSLLLGEMEIELGRLSDAEALLTRAYERSGAPQIIDALLGLLQRQGRYAEALRLTDALDEQTRAARRSVIAERAGELREAARQLEIQLSQTEGAERAPLLIRLARLRYLEDRAPTRAWPLLDEADALSTNPAAAASLRFAILSAEGQADEAVQMLDDLVATKDCRDVRFLRARQREGSGDVAGAEEDYRAACEFTRDDASRLVLGEFLARQGRLDEAIETWREGLEIAPDAVAIKRALAKGLFARSAEGDRAAMRELLTQLPDNDRDAELILLRAADAGDGVDELLRRAARVATGAPTAFVGLTNMAMQRGDLSLARDIVTRGSTMHPTDANLRLLRALLELQGGRLSEARGLARDVLRNDPLNDTAHDIVFQAALRQGDIAALAEEASSLQVLSQREDATEGVHLAYARTLLALGKTNDAIKALNDYVATERGSQSVVTALLLYDIWRDRYEKTKSAADGDEARRQAARAMELDATNIAAQSAQIRMLTLDGDFAAIAEIADAEEATAPVLLAAANALRQSPEWREKAVELCQRAADESPAPNAFILLGHCQYALGRAQEAREAYEHAVALNPQAADARNNLAWILANDFQEYDAAEEHARQAVAVEPGNPSFHDTLGFVLMQRGDYQQARGAFRDAAARAMDLIDVANANPLAGPEQRAAAERLRATSLYHLAQASEKLGDRSILRDVLREAASIDEKRGVFDAEQRAEIQRMLTAIENPVN